MSNVNYIKVNIKVFLYIIVIINMSKLQKVYFVHILNHFITTNILRLGKTNIRLQLFSIVLLDNNTYNSVIRTCII